MKKIPITLILYCKKVSMKSIDVVLAAMLYGINKSNKKSWYYQVTKKLRMTRHHQNVYVYSQLAIVFPGGGNRKQGNTTVWDSYVYCVLEHLINTV